MLPEPIGDNHECDHCRDTGVCRESWCEMRTGAIWQCTECDAWDELDRDVRAMVTREEWREAAAYAAGR